MIVVHNSSIIMTENLWTKVLRDESSFIDYFMTEVPIL